MSLIGNEYITTNEKYENQQYLKVEIISETEAECKLKTNTTEMDEIGKFVDYAKCGEVFVSNCGKIYFACSFCDSTFKKPELFKNHIIKQHLNLEEIGDSEDSISNRSPHHFECENSEACADVKASYNLDDGVHNYSSIIEDSEFDPKITSANTDYEFDPKTTSANTDYIAHLCNSLDDTLYELTPHKSKNEKRSLTVPALKVSANMAHGTSKTEETTDSNFYCDICNKKFRTKRGLVIHTARHDVMVSEYDNSKGDGSKKNTPVKTKENLRKCSYCGKEFRCRSERVYHERTHTGEKPHTCKVCGNTFYWNYQLEDHMRTHTGERPYSCPQCPVKFASKGHRNSHVRAHLAIKRHSCEVCNRRFTRKVDKTIHMRIHTGEKPFQCEVCGSSFVASNKLYEHMKRHTNTKPHQCEVCHKHFYSKDLLKNHQATHSDERPFECNLCEARFPRKRALQCHLKIHSDVKEYVCSICNKAFSQNAGLYSHMKTHGYKSGNKTKEL